MKNCFKLLRLALPCLLLLVSKTLQAQHKPVTGFAISGNIDGAPDGSIVKLFDIEAQKVLDSTVTTHGSFALKGHVYQPTACWLRCNSEYAIIQVENIPMTFSSPLKEMKLNYTALGGREQSLQNELNALQRVYERIYTRAYDSLNNKLYTDTVHKARLFKTFMVAQDKYMDIYVAFGRKNIGSYLGLDIVYRNRKHIRKDSLLLLYNSLPPVLKGTAKAQSLHIFATEKLAQKGQHFLDFEARTIQGKPFRLSDLKGKYIYLAFGSFSCGPCRMENQEIAKRYDKLYQQLEIVNFSLDINLEEWQKAAKIDGITWYNVSDMKGMAGRIKTLYNVQAMPTSFLIGPDGIIIERFDGYNEENIVKVEQMVSRSGTSQFKSN